MENKTNKHNTELQWVARPGKNLGSDKTADFGIKFGKMLY